MLLHLHLHHIRHDESTDGEFSLTQRNCYWDSHVLYGSILRNAYLFNVQRASMLLFPVKLIEVA
jgi:hypothetical protein